MNLLITGGCGFIGSNFLLFFAKKYPDYKIVNLDKLTYAGNIDNVKEIADWPNYTFVKGDILDRALINKIIIDNKIEVIINFAAETHVDRSISGPAAFIETNVAGTQVLLDSALENKIKLFYQISTDEVYGSLGQTGAFTEATNLNPRSPYSASKAAADLLTMAYFSTYNLPVVISRCSNNYGPKQYPEKIIPLFVHNLLQNKKVPVYGTGENVRDWIHVNDHARAVDLILHKGQKGEIYNIGGGNELSNLELTKKILKILNKSEDMIEFVTDRLGHDFRYAIDASKIANELGFKPEISFEEGLRETVEGIRDAHSSPFTKGEVRRGYKPTYLFTLLTL